MPVDYSNQALINNIIRRCFTPQSQITFTPTAFCLTANDEMQGEVVPLIMSARSDYYLTFEDFTPDSEGKITIPSQAAGDKLADVMIAQGSSAGGNLCLYNLTQYELPVIGGYGASGVTFGSFGIVGGTGGFYIQGSDLFLYPPNLTNSNQRIRLYYYARPLVLAAPSEYGQIVSIDYLNNSVVLTNVPTSWATGTEINIVSNIPQFKTKVFSDTIVSVSSPTVNLTDVSNASVGDYVSLLGYSGVAQIHVDAHGYLAQLAAAKTLESLGDKEGMDAALLKAESLKKGVLIQVSNRVDNSPKIISNPNGGILGAVSWSGWGNSRRGF